MLIALAASLLAVVAWVYLLAGHGGFWRTDQRLPPVTAEPADPAALARDRGRRCRRGTRRRSCPETLPTLLTQDYQGQLTVVLVDDESTDGTAEVRGEP